MNSIEDRLKIIMGGMSGRKFALALGMSPTTVNQYLNGRMPPADFIALVCGRFGVNATWLLTGEGEMKPGEGSYPPADVLKTADVARALGEGFLLEKATEGHGGFKFTGRIKGQDVVINSKDLTDQDLIVIDEQHRVMIDLMDSAPEEKNEIVALVKGYLMGKKRNKAGI